MYLSFAEIGPRGPSAQIYIRRLVDLCADLAESLYLSGMGTTATAVVLEGPEIRLYGRIITPESEISHERMGDCIHYLGLPTPQNPYFYYA